MVYSALPTRTPEGAEASIDPDFVRLLFDSISECVCSIDQDGVTTFCNPAFVTSLGLPSPADAIGMKLHDVIHHTHPDGTPYPASDCPILRCARDGEGVYVTDEVFHRVDGSVMPVTYRALPFRKDGVLLGAICSFIDVSGAREAEAAFRAGEARFQRLAQAMPNHVWTAPANGWVDWYNDTALHYSGFSASDLDRRNVLHPDDLAAAAALWRSCLKSGEIYETEFRIRRADGVYRWHIVRAVPIRDTGGRIVQWIGCDTDIHELRVAQEALAELNATLEARVEARTRERDRVWKYSRDLQVVFDLQGVFRAANPAWTETLGWRIDDIIGRHYRDFIHPEDTGGGAAPWYEEEELSVENRFRHRDGGYRWVSWVGGREGDLVYVSGRHVTAEKESEARLAAIEAQLRQAQKMEAVGQLTGGVAHDFNNLLQIISGNLQLLEKAVEGNERAERRLEQAHAAVDRGAKLAGQLLAFGRRQPLAPRRVHIGRMIIGMDDMLARTLGEEITISVLGADRPLGALVDPSQIENAVLNLAINARDAMDGVGVLTLEVDEVVLDDAYARAHPDVAPGAYVMLAVSDTGVGMPPELLDQVFEPFFTTKAEGRGSGLGLSMVYGFVKQSGGHVRIDSRVGEGTTVRLYFPRLLGEQADPDASREGGVDAVSGGGETILVAEDDDAVRETVVETLAGLGYVVLVASDALAARDIIAAGASIDLLFTDVVMPGPLRSADLAHELASRAPPIPVLFTSGYTDSALMHDGRLNEGVELLSKPYSRAALAAKLREVLVRPAASRPRPAVV